MMNFLDTIGGVVLPALTILGALLLIGFVMARLYRRTSKELSLVRTGLGGQKVVVNGGCMVLPIVHEVIPVNMNTLRLEVGRKCAEALITQDRMRVDVKAEFYVRVRNTEDEIAAAAQTLGYRTQKPNDLKDLVEGKFIDGLRSAAAEMSMVDLHERRPSFVLKVQEAVAEDLLKNGLELESVSLTSLDQTRKEFFDPDNAFDAAGLTKLTEEIESRRATRNQIEQDTRVAIAKKNLETEQDTLSINRESEYSRLEQKREIAIRTSEQATNIAQKEAENERASAEAKIDAERAVDEARITKSKVLKLAAQDESIAVAERSEQDSAAQTVADEARAKAVSAREKVVTVEETEKAQRDKTIKLVKAQEEAERDAIMVKTAAAANRQAAEDNAEAVRTGAQAQADEARIVAEGESAAKTLVAAADAVRYETEANGQRALNQSENVVTERVAVLRTRLAIIANLEGIVKESVRPMENIDGIKIVQMGGGGPGFSSLSDGAATGGPADGLVRAALAYRSQAPLIDAVMKEIGLDGGSLDGLTRHLTDALADVQPKAPAPDADNGGGDDAGTGAEAA